MNAMLRPVESIRVPPHSVDAEQSVLGGLMLNGAALAKVADWLAPEDFYRRDHQLIYRAIRELAEKGQPFDAVTLGEWFEANGQVEMVAGGSYLVELAVTTPSAANIVAYAEIVRDKSVLRTGIEIGTGLVNDCFQPDGRDTGLILGERLHALSALRGDSRAGGLVSSSETLGDWFADLTDRYENGGGITGLPYPWAKVNAVTHGLQAGELTIIAARPSMGKSVMGLNLALMNAMRKVNTALFSLEMTGRQVNRRNIASLGKVPHDWLLAPNRDGDDYWPFVTAAIREIRESTLLVDESAGLRIEQIAARARRAHMQKPIGLIVLDHMHDVALPGKREARFENGAIAESGKSLAKEFGCPAVWLAQLNRGVESRPNKRPNMGDLRESGEIEQKADVIWFLYREDYYRRNEPGYQPTRAVELILAKGRDLEVGKPILLREDFAHMRLMDWEGPEPDFGEPTTTKKGLR
jgi:replicative DNA helicase